MGMSQTTTSDKSPPVPVDEGLFPALGFTISTFRVTGGGVDWANKTKEHKQTSAIPPGIRIRRIRSNVRTRKCTPGSG